MDPKPVRETYRAVPRPRESQVPTSSTHKFDPHSRPFPLRRVCTTENYHHHEAQPVKSSRYRQYPRPQRLYTRGEFQARTSEILKHDNAPGGHNDFDPDFSNRKPAGTSTLKQVRSFPDPRSLTDPLPKSGRDLEPNNRQRSSTAPKRSQPHPPKNKPYEFKTDSFPQPHHFSTLNPKSPYNPLNFIPGGVNSSGYLYLPSPASQPAARSEPDPAPPGDVPAEFRAFHAQGDFGFAFNKPCSAEPTPETRQAPPRPIFRLELPSSQEIKDRKRKKSGARRFTSSLKKLFFRKPKSEPENTTATLANAEYSPAPKAGATSKSRPSAIARGRFREELGEADSTQAAQLEEQLKGVDSAQAERFEEQLRKPLITVTVDPPPEKDSTPPRDTPNMFSTGHLDPSSAVMAITKQKAEAMRLAREQGFIVREMCRRAKTDVPPYTFEELIGKGSYGRVYKGFVFTIFITVCIMNY